MAWMDLQYQYDLDQLRRQDARRDAAKWRLLHQGQSHSTWLSRRICWLLCQLGRWLVRLGQQLQHQGVYKHDLARS